MPTDPPIPPLPPFAPSLLELLMAWANEAAPQVRIDLSVDLAQYLANCGDGDDAKQAALARLVSFMGTPGVQFSLAYKCGFHAPMPPPWLNDVEDRESPRAQESPDSGPSTEPTPGAS